MAQPLLWAGARPVTSPASSAAGTWNLGKIWLTAVALGVLYLPFLPTGFDFADDSDYAYPSASPSVSSFLALVYDRTVSDFRERGPFRPVAWAWWTGQGELFGGNPLPWRGVRLLWTIVSAACLLFFFRELGLDLRASIVVAALAFWNPARIEIWLSLNFMEGTAMPFALGSLICAVRAGKSRRPLPWDILGMGCALLAVLSKNVFMAVIPAQMCLRLLGPGLSWHEGLKKHGVRAGMLGLVALVPIVHFILYKINYRPGQYGVGWSGEQPLRLMRTMAGGMGLEYLGPALLAGAWVIWRNPRLPPVTQDPRSFLSNHQRAWAAGVLLFVFGYGVYLPIAGVSGRYVVPGIWGLDVLLALFLTRLGEVPWCSWKRLAHGLVGCAVVVSAVINIGKQTKVHARIQMLWDVADAVEQRGPSCRSLGWVCVNYLNKTGNLLEIGEGHHFAQHLAGRRAGDLEVHLLDPQGRDVRHPEVISAQPEWLVSGTAPPAGGTWTRVAAFERPYWAGLRHYQCFLWTRGSDDVH